MRLGAGNEPNAASSADPGQKAQPYVPSRLAASVALLGVILVALNLRAAVTSLSPVYLQMSKSFPLSTIAIGILGTLPVLCFALFGLLAPKLIHKAGLELSLTLTMALVFVGEIARSSVDNFYFFCFFSLVCLAGMGLANVILPPVIKHYFPNKVGVLTSLYVALVAVSASLPSYVAVWVTKRAGWRVSTGMWGLLALAAALSWLFLIRGSVKPTIAGRTGQHKVWAWLPSWSIALIFGIGALNMYAMLAWLPSVLISFGVAQASAGILLAMYNIVGFPHSLLVPVVLTRLKNPYIVIAFASVCLIVGYLGIIYQSQHAIFWIVPAGLGVMTVPVGLTLINTRSRTDDGAASLSGFVQGVGYLVAASGPLAFAKLHQATGEWNKSFWFLIGTAVLPLLLGFILWKPRFIEDVSSPA